MKRSEALDLVKRIMAQPKDRYPLSQMADALMAAEVRGARLGMEPRDHSIEGGDGSDGGYAVGYVPHSVMVSQIDCAVAATRRQYDALLAAAVELTDFAWTAVTADCEESRVYLNAKVQALRNAIAGVAAATERGEG